jgi:hypothetical protein
VRSVGVFPVKPAAASPEVRTHTRASTQTGWNPANVVDDNSEDTPSWHTLKSSSTCPGLIGLV